MRQKLQIRPEQIHPQIFPGMPGLLVASDLSITAVVQITTGRESLS
jgi:hypothetical protein